MTASKSATGPSQWLPPHFRLPPASVHHHGVLKKEGSRWVIEADPQCVLMAKRLFPGSSGRGVGHAAFPVSERLFEDLLWFLQRWPLHIADPDTFESARRAAKTAHARRAELATGLQRAPTPARLHGTLLPFQEEALDWCLRNPRTLLADDQGLGKTLVGLAWISSRPPPWLIVVQPHLVRQWSAALERWLGATPLPRPAPRRPPAVVPPGGLGYHVLQGRTPYAVPPGTTILLTHYLLLEGWRHALLERGVDTLLFDEIQELRHEVSAKYAAASAIAQPASGVLGLSGTPIHNYGAEIWSVINILEFHALGDRESFTREWCRAYNDPVLRDPAILNAHLRREGLLLRRLKADVLKQLPPKRREVVLLDSDTSMFHRLIATATATARTAMATQDHLARGRLIREAINESRRVTGLAKAAAVAAFVSGLVAAGEAVVVFAHHHDVVDALLERWGRDKVALLTGREDAATRAANLTAFQQGQRSIALISLRSAAGLDGLQQRAAVAVFAELDWSPAVHAQAEDRLHRMGQDDSVLCYYAVAAEGTDADMREALGLKVAQFANLMGDRPETDEDRLLASVAIREHIDNIIRRLADHGDHHPTPPDPVRAIDDAAPASRC